MVIELSEYMLIRSNFEVLVINVYNVRYHYSIMISNSININLLMKRYINWGVGNLRNDISTHIFNYDISLNKQKNLQCI